jgi:hypothetical protein
MPYYKRQLFVQILIVMKKVSCMQCLSEMNDIIYRWFKTVNYYLIVTSNDKYFIHFQDNSTVWRFVFNV